MKRAVHPLWAQNVERHPRRICDRLYISAAAAHTLKVTASVARRAGKGGYGLPDISPQYLAGGWGMRPADCSSHFWGRTGQAGPAAGARLPAFAYGKGEGRISTAPGTDAIVTAAYQASGEKRRRQQPPAYSRERDWFSRLCAVSADLSAAHDARPIWDRAQAAGHPAIPLSVRASQGYFLGNEEAAWIFGREPARAAYCACG